VTAAGAILSILASSVIILGGLLAVVRALWHLVSAIRESIGATKTLTRKFEEFTPAVDGRLSSIEDRLSRLEHHD